MLTLAVYHNIYLTYDQRIALVEGKPVETVGASVPVWFLLGTTSEPADEVFCKYLITNEPNEYPVTALATGYKINLPQIPSGIKLSHRINPKEWDKLTNIEKDKWHKNHKMLPSPIDLLNPEEGGTSSLRFKRYTKIKENGRRLNAIHNIQIYDLEYFRSTLI